MKPLFTWTADESRPQGMPTMMSNAVSDIAAYSGRGKCNSRALNLSLPMLTSNMQRRSSWRSKGLASIPTLTTTPAAQAATRQSTSQRQRWAGKNTKLLFQRIRYVESKSTNTLVHRFLDSRTFDTASVSTHRNLERRGSGLEVAQGL